MDILQWQETDKNQFAVFIRDLSQNLNNIKYMIEDSFQKEETPKHSRKGKKGKKGKKKATKGKKKGKIGKKGKKGRSRRLTMRRRR